MILSSGLVYDSIPAHPDAIYRPQNRPTPLNVPSEDSVAIAPRLMDVNPVVAAPLVAGGSGFSPWLIIGPLLVLLGAMALAALVYAIKKKNDSAKKGTDDKKTNKRKEENPKDDDHAKQLPIENVPLTSMKSDSIIKQQKRSVPMSSTAKGKR